MGASLVSLVSELLRSEDKQSNIVSEFRRRSGGIFLPLVELLKGALSSTDSTVLSVLCYTFSQIYMQRNLFE